MENKPKAIYITNLKPIGSTSGLKGRIYKHKLSDDFWQVDDKGQEYLPFTIWENKAPDKYGYTHNMQLDQWKPEPKSESVGNESTNDLPF